MSGLRNVQSAVAIYSKHLSAIVSRSGLLDSDISRIKRSLEFLIGENRKHKVILNALLKRIEKESTHVY